jgi:inosine/xanthosine triphosphatase
MIRVVVASTNPVKIESARRGIAALYGETEASGIEVESGVSAQPFGSEETLRGAVNRAQAARTLYSEADFAVGIEGGVEAVGDDLLAMAWVVIIDRAGKTGKARSGSFVLPRKIAALIRDEGLELGDADDRVFGQSDSKRKNGSVGLLTGDVITRADFYTPAVTLALIPFHNPELEF